MEIFSDNWIAILSLLVAVIGGVPGILSVIKHYRNRPLLEFTVAQVITGQRENGGSTESVIMLCGAITNSTDAPLTPDHFELEMAIDGGAFISFTKRLMPENPEFLSDTQDIQLSSPNDLQRWRQAITMAAPVDGQFMFTSRDIELSTLQNAREYSIRLTCHDVFGKQHTTTFPYDATSNCSNVMFPGHGLTIRDKV